MRGLDLEPSGGQQNPVDRCTDLVTRSGEAHLAGREPPEPGGLPGAAGGGGALGPSLSMGGASGGGKGACRRLGPQGHLSRGRVGRGCGGSRPAAPQGRCSPSLQTRCTAGRVFSNWEENGSLRQTGQRIATPITVSTVIILVSRGDS